MHDDLEPCPDCGAVTGGVVRDPETGEMVDVWWCAQCGRTDDGAVTPVGGGRGAFFPPAPGDSQQ